MEVVKHGHSHRGTQPDADDEIVLDNLLRAIMDDVWWLVGVTAVVLSLAGLYCLFAKPVYLADALIKIEQADDSSQLLMQLGSVTSAIAPVPTDAEMAIIQSRDVVRPVVKKFKLDLSVEPKQVPIIASLSSAFATPGKPSPAWLGLSSFAWGGELLDVDSVQVPPALEGKKLILTVADSKHFELRDPDGTALLRGEVGYPVSGQGVTILVKQLVARPGTRFSIIRINDVDAVNLFLKDVQVQEQGKLTGLVDVSMENKDPQFAADVTNELAQSYLRQHVQSKQKNAENMLSFLKSEEPRLKADLDKAEMALAHYQTQSGSITAGEEAKVYLAGSVAYEQQISAMRLQLVALQQRFGDDHPMIRATSEQIEQLVDQRDRYENRFRRLPETQVRAVQLERDAKVAAEIYELVLTREQELSVQKAGTGGSAQLVDVALRPGTPIKPKRILILSAALMLGLILGSIVILSRRRLFKGIEDPEEIERMFQLPICGMVPLSEHEAQFTKVSVSGSLRRYPVLAHSNPGDVCVESLRSLRTSLQFALMSASNRIVMLTGPVPGVGKSFLTVNLAVLLANSGKKVLMIDADMRRGSLERYIGGGAANGLAELLAGKIEINAAVRESSIDGLSFVSCGQRPSNPAELLTSTRLVNCLAEFEMNYDVVLIDTPPVLAVTDASLVGEHAGTNFLVMRSGMHRPFEIADAIKRLRVAGIDLKGGSSTACRGMVAMDMVLYITI
ncbi:polysaccharide biosynthesis tyrosine autokinase [Paraburkholderia sp. LEh10]|nr:polysaccharide biosynthesis tyrosine autokinase [Paraburkholderia sp. LEh10]MBP0596187.1 polysaccharide biosynthesis tyrosine autokinase [Paraburkholderia sp. LEh10]